MKYSSPYTIGFDSSTLLTLISPAFFKPPKNAEKGNEGTDYPLKNIESLIFLTLIMIDHHNDLSSIS